jgi:hypothetical protein
MNQVGLVATWNGEANMVRAMPRPKPKRGGSGGEKVVIYVETPPYIKAQMEELASLHNRRLTGEVIQALQEYLEKYDRWPEGGAK